MNKTVINTLIRHMQQAGIVTKATPWMIEGKGTRELNVRYVGIKPPGDWLDILSANNNLLIKLSFDKKTSVVEYFLANQPPFIRITGTTFSGNEKWETLLGELKRQLKKDKEDVLHHRETVNNLYSRIAKQLKL